MRYLLDTNICIAFLNGKSATIKERLLATTPEDCALCSVVKSELYYGARHSQRVDRNLQKLESFFELFPSLAFDDAASQQYGIVRAQLRTSGQLIGTHDLEIAAIALAHDLVLVTHNQREFNRVPGLRVESW